MKQKQNDLVVRRNADAENEKPECVERKRKKKRKREKTVVIVYKNISSSKPLDCCWTCGAGGQRERRCCSPLIAAKTPCVFV